MSDSKDARTNQLVLAVVDSGDWHVELHVRMFGRQLLVEMKKKQHADEAWNQRMEMIIDFEQWEDLAACVESLIISRS